MSNGKIPNIRKPDTIKDEIKKLTEELEKSKEFYSYEKLVEVGTSGDRIGFFDVGALRVILNSLYNGGILQIRHAAYGKANVWMNPQRNRLIVNDNVNITEDNILSFMLHQPCIWYLNVDEKARDSKVNIQFATSGLKTDQDERSDDDMEGTGNGEEKN